MINKATIHFHQEKGQDLIEYALVLPLLLLVMLGIMEFGILFWNYNTIANAAREGARAGIIPGVTPEEIRTRALDSMVGLNHDLLDTATGVNPTNMNGIELNTTPNTIQVTVVYNTRLITAPMIGAVTGDGTITLSARATMNRE
jgi:hypothetical protein